MTPEQTEATVNRYGEILARGVGEGIARKLSWLPCSICKIRLAFYIFLRESIARRSLTKTMGEQLKNAYYALNYFIADDDAEIINELHNRVRNSNEKILSESEREIYQQFFRRIGRMDELFEINSYINECFGRRDNQDFILQR